jgi:cytochrome c oxidase subunit II
MRGQVTGKTFQDAAVSASRQSAQEEHQQIHAKELRNSCCSSQASLVAASRPRLYFPGGIKLNSVFRIVFLFLLAGFAVTSGFAHLGNVSQADRDVQVIEVTAKKYEYTPLPLRVKRGAQVQLKITSLDKTHGFKINLYPDGSDGKGDPGLIFSSKEDCFKIEKESPIVVQFVARTPGTYSFHCCNRCGIGHGGMKGQLIVEP